MKPAIACLLFGSLLLFGCGGSSGSPTGGNGGGDPGVGGGVCKSPSDCTSGQVCCARITLTGGNIPNCTSGAVQVACEAAAGCATALPASCTSTDVVRYCKANADCTESAHDQCCSFTQNGSTVHFCVSALEASLGGGTCN